MASQGHTIDEALANLAEAVELYLEEVDDPAGHITATPLGDLGGASEDFGQQTSRCVRPARYKPGQESHGLAGQGGVRLHRLGRLIQGRS